MSIELPCPISVTMLKNMCRFLALYIEHAHITPDAEELKYTQALDNLRRCGVLIPVTQ